MRADIHDGNLYLFNFTVRGPKAARVLKGLLDTGSSMCACTYKVITTLRARPVDYRRAMTTEVVRVTSLPDGIDFIMGMSVLQHCNLTLDDNGMTVTWRDV